MASVQALLDTSILIDLWRGSSGAIAWMRQYQSTTFGLPVIVCMELIDGARNAAERQRAIAFIMSYPMLQLSIADSRWAQKQHSQFKLSYSVGILDALIAAPAARLNVPIYTLNTKHFTILPGVSAIRPY